MRLSHCKLTAIKSRAQTKHTHFSDDKFSAFWVVMWSVTDCGQYRLSPRVGSACAASTRPRSLRLWGLCFDFCWRHDISQKWLICLLPSKEEFQLNCFVSTLLVPCILGLQVRNGGVCSFYASVCPDKEKGPLGPSSTPADWQICWAGQFSALSYSLSMPVSLTPSLDNSDRAMGTLVITTTQTARVFHGNTVSGSHLSDVSEVLNKLLLFDSVIPFLACIPRGKKDLHKNSCWILIGWSSQEFYSNEKLEISWNAPQWLHYGLSILCHGRQ